MPCIVEPFLAIILFCQPKADENAERKDLQCAVNVNVQKPSYVLGLGMQAERTCLAL